MGHRVAVEGAIHTGRDEERQEEEEQGEEEHRLARREVLPVREVAVHAEEHHADEGDVGRVKEQIEETVKGARRCL